MNKKLFYSQNEMYKNYLSVSKLKKKKSFNELRCQNCDKNKK